MRARTPIAAAHRDLKPDEKVYIGISEFFVGQPIQCGEFIVIDQSTGKLAPYQQVPA